MIRTRKLFRSELSDVCDCTVAVAGAAYCFVRLQFLRSCVCLIASAEIRRSKQPTCKQTNAKKQTRDWNVQSPIECVLVNVYPHYYECSGYSQRSQDSVVFSLFLGPVISSYRLPNIYTQGLVGWLDFVCVCVRFGSVWLGSVRFARLSIIILQLLHRITGAGTIHRTHTQK